MCDPFMTSRRRFKTEFNRYLSNVNLNFLPPMPRPVPPKKVHFASNYVSNSNMNYSNMNMKISHKSFNNNSTESTDMNMNTSNRVEFINRQYQPQKQQQQQQQKQEQQEQQHQRNDNFANQNMMVRSDDFYWDEIIYVFIDIIYLSISICFAYSIVINFDGKTKRLLFWFCFLILIVEYLFMNK